LQYFATEIFVDDFRRFAAAKGLVHQAGDSTVDRISFDRLLQKNK